MSHDQNGSGSQAADVEMNSENESKAKKNLQKLDDTMEEEEGQQEPMRDNLKKMAAERADKNMKPTK